MGLWKVDLLRVTPPIAPKGVMPGSNFDLPGQFSQV
jgi:hypothetical protein